MSFTTSLQQLSNWLGSLWRGQGYFVLEQTLTHERTERKNEYKALWDILLEERAKNEAERQALMDTILLIKGVPPVHKQQQHKPATVRETGFEGAMREAREAKAERQAEMARKAEEWKRANLKHSQQAESGEKVN